MSIGQYSSIERSSYPSISTTGTVTVDWTKTKDITSTTKKGKAPVHPLFLEFAEVTEDPYWKQKFLSAAAGKFPRGFSYNSQVLSYKDGSRTFSIEIPLGPYEGSSAVMEFMQNRKGLYSELDSSRKAEEERNAEQTEFIWTKLSKEMKNILIVDYIFELSSVLKLKSLETEQLTAVVKTGIFDKQIGKEEIVIGDRRITEITTLCWDNKLRIFTLAQGKKRALKKYQKKEKETAPVEELWNKYIVNFYSYEETEKKIKNKPAQSIYLEGPNTMNLIDLENNIVEFEVLN